MLYNEEAVRANIRNREGKRIFYLGKGDQLTSAARDYLSRERIEIRPGEQAKQATLKLYFGYGVPLDAVIGRRCHLFGGRKVEPKLNAEQPLRSRQRLLMKYP